MNENILDDMHELLGTHLFNFIMNPNTLRPLLISSLKKRRRYQSLSQSETTLIHLAYDIYNGSGHSQCINLYSLDQENRTRALKALEKFLQVSKL